MKWSHPILWEFPVKIDADWHMFLSAEFALFYPFSICLLFNFGYLLVGTESVRLYRVKVFIWLSIPNIHLYVFLVHFTFLFGRMLLSSCCYWRCCVWMFLLLVLLLSGSIFVVIVFWIASLYCWSILRDIFEFFSIYCRQFCCSCYYCFCRCCCYYCLLFTMVVDYTLSSGALFVNLLKI